MEAVPPGSGSTIVMPAGGDGIRGDGNSGEGSGSSGVSVWLAAGLLGSHKNRLIVVSQVHFSSQSPAQMLFDPFFIH
jgi:hypothetical protein